MKYGPGMIGLACGELGRFSDVLPAIVGLQKPAGTVFMKSSGLGPAQPFNQIAAKFLSMPHLEWLFLTNDDNVCPQDTIPRLLDRNVDVVSGLYFGRIQPFEPILFDKWTWEDLEVSDPSRLLNPQSVTKRRWWHRHLMKLGEHGMIPAAAVGDGCLLIRRHVLEKLQYPWWEYGETFSDVCDHDVVFSRKVTEAGFGLYCDLDVLVDHIAIMAVRPVRHPDGRWEVYLSQGDSRNLSVPCPSLL